MGAFKFQSITFPPEIEISGDVKDLIGQILNPDPQKRLSIEGILQHKWCQEEGESITATQHFLKEYSERAQTEEQKTASKIVKNIKKDILDALRSSINQIVALVTRWHETFDAVRKLDPKKLDLSELHMLNLIKIFKLLSQVENMELEMPNRISSKLLLPKLLDAARLKEMRDLKAAVLQEIDELGGRLDMKNKPPKDLEEKHLDAILAACDAVVSKGDISKAFDYRELLRLYKACQSMLTCFTRDYDQMTVNVFLKIPMLQRLAEDRGLKSDEFLDLLQEFVNNLNVSTELPGEDIREPQSGLQFLELYSIAFRVHTVRPNKAAVEKALKGIDGRIEARLKDLK